MRDIRFLFMGRVQQVKRFPSLIPQLPNHSNMNTEKTFTTSILSNGHSYSDFLPIGTQLVNDWGKTVTVVGHQVSEIDPPETEPYDC